MEGAIIIIITTMTTITATITITTHIVIGSVWGKGWLLGELPASHSWGHPTFFLFLSLSQVLGLKDTCGI